jgi:hypothetical protein
MLLESVLLSPRSLETRVRWTPLVYFGYHGTLPLALLPKDLSMPDFPYIWLFSLNSPTRVRSPKSPGFFGIWLLFVLRSWHT